MPLDRLQDVSRNAVDPHVGARGRRIVFIPWDPVEGEEWAIKTAQWNHATGNKYEIVHYTPGMGSPFLRIANGEPSTAIYIRGHGNPGVPYIQVKVTVGNTVAERKLPITEACDRLIASGLLPSFSGVIKFFHCHSATVLTQNAYQQECAKVRSNNTTVKQGYKQGMLTKVQRDTFLKEIHPNKSIARNGADYMRKRGFRGCLYYGYLGPLASEYGDDGAGGIHKMVELAGLNSPPPHLVGLGTSRASQARVMV